ncbi:MAG: hypothetical protein QOJ11_246 [Frankiales bacterium]|jgi:hypothetical protein|nr:hypothetical protein [Frankiales bacterium]
MQEQAPAPNLTSQSSPGGLGLASTQLPLTARLDSWYDSQPLPANLRLLFVPNGTEPDAQPGLRRGFEALLAAGELERYTAFPLQYEQQSARSSEVWERLIATARLDEPTVILIQHLGHGGLTPRILSDLRAAAPGATLAYHDMDPFGRGKPLPPDARLITGQADVVLGCGVTDFRQAFLRSGARRFLYAPHAYDDDRFGTAWTPSADRQFDVVFIANHNHSRLPWRRLPGAAGRVALVRLLQKRFGSKAGIFGRGWQGLGAQGPVAYSDQTAVLRSAWTSANWDYFPAEEAYFSDRLPISLAAGVSHVTTRHPGYLELFGERPGLHLCDSPESVVATVEKLIAAGEGWLIRDGEAARQFAWDNMGQHRQARALLARITSEEASL